MRLVLALAALLFAAACGSGPPAGQQPIPPGGQGTGTTTSAPPPTTATPPSTSAETRCGPQTMTATTRDQPIPRCLRVGATLHITTELSPRQPWTMPISSDDTIVRCVAKPLADGAADATCTALRRGTVTITTGTSPFTGDPHGPPQSDWRVSITVV